jgi:Domain of unknown function (DUF5658)
MTQLLVQFSYLQVLDFMTTLAFLMNGIQEGNPLVRLALRYGPSPLAGLLLVKMVALALGIYCWRFGRTKLLTRINVLFALIVTWNLAALILESAGRA